MAGIEDFIEVFRGQSTHLNPFRTRSSSLMNPKGLLTVGKYATTQPNVAIDYASRNFPNLVKKVKISPKELNIGKKVFDKLSSYGASEIAKEQGFNILSKKNADKLKVDVLKTFMSNAKALTPLATKGLSFISSLPVSTLIMTLHSTPANADEANMQLEEFAKLAEENNIEMGSNMDKALPGGSKDI